VLLLEESPHFTLGHEPATACLYASWQGRHTSEPTRADYQLILRQVRATHSTRLLNDCLLDEDGWRELINWLAEDYFKHLAKAGIRAVAWVLPKNPQAFCATYQVLTRVQQPLIDTFADPEAAYRWLHGSAVATA
jgi:hypothetical protein